MSSVQGIEAIDLWVRNGTPDVPQDGKYHIVHKGMIVGSFRSEAKAIAKYRKLVEESGYTPLGLGSPDPDASRREYIEQTLNRTDEYWVSAPNHRRRGGYR